VVLATGARAADGVTEINQARALAGGITAGDAPGLPVTLSQPGSYLLTGDLTTNATTTAIEISADRASLDLNGFAIVGPTVCDQTGCTPTGTAAGVLQTSGEGASVSGGSVVGISGNCVFLLEGARVDELHVSNCAGAGIRVGAQSLVTDSVVRAVGAIGIETDPGAAFEGNLIADAGLEGSGGSVNGPTAIGGNLCDDGRCSSRGERRYYLSASLSAGDAALSACAPGYHMAALWEITDTSALAYDATLGQFAPDSGEGPASFPQDGFFSVGWVRTGYNSDFSSQPGRANCSVWTSTVGEGTVARLSSQWTAGFTVSPPWEALTRPCAEPLPVWCVQN
jgi:hypothetical protein